MIIDVHSYPAVALPYERHADIARPPICLGVDDIHTPDWLLDAARAALSAVGECRVDEPFQGTYVPLRHFRHDARVASIMIEIRRDVYSREDGRAGAHVARAGEVPGGTRTRGGRLRNWEAGRGPPRRRPC